jgi:hypothetical protein
LKRVDDDVLRIRLGCESLTDRQRGAAVGKADLDDDAWPLQDQQVANRIAERGRKRDALEVTIGPRIGWPGRDEVVAHALDTCKEIGLLGHRPSIARAPRGFRRDEGGEVRCSR